MHIVDRINTVGGICDDVLNHINTFAVRAELVRVVGASLNEGVVARRVGDQFLGHALRDELGFQRDDDLSDDLALLRVQRGVDALGPARGAGAGNI